MEHYLSFFKQTTCKQILGATDFLKPRSKSDLRNSFLRKHIIYQETLSGYPDYGFRGSFLERRGKFSGSKAHFKIKTCWTVAQSQAHKPVNFASLTDSFIVLFSELLKLWSRIQTQWTENNFPGPKRFRYFQETGRWFSLFTVSFGVRCR